MIRVGKIVATHGLQGSLILQHIVGKSDWLKKDDVLFVEVVKDSFIPHFVVQAKTSNHEEYIISLEDIDTVELAKKLINRNIYAKEENLKTHADDSPLLWIGFNLVDKTKGGLGEIEDVMQAGAQWLAKITYQEKEVLIPLVEQMIIDVNIRNKYIRMDLPEGLLEVYIGD